jgi:hypothetical protein
MAFIRKKGDYYYLVMSYRNDDGDVRQRVLAYLGKEPLINKEVKTEVGEKFPELDIDWDSIKETEDKPSKAKKKNDEWLKWD